MRTTSTSEVEIDRTVPVLTDLKSLGVEDVFFVVCDGPKGLLDSGNAVFPAAIAGDLHHPPHLRHLPRA